jgi:uncharacterized protein
MGHAGPASWMRQQIALLFLLGAGFGVARSDGREFRLFRFDAEIGSESFTLGPDSLVGGLSVETSSRMDLSGRAVATKQKLTVADRTFALRKYEVTADVQGEQQRIAASRTADSVVVEIEASGTHLRRAFSARGDVLVLDNLVMTHLALLAMRVAQRGYQPETLQVVVPQVGALMPAAVTPGALGADGSRKVEIRIASVTEVIRVGAAGEIDGADVPSQGLRFERVKPGEAVSAPRPKTPLPDLARSVPEGTAQPGRALFEEQSVRISSRAAGLGGILTLPHAGQRIPYPAVLIVQGAGSQDRDGTTGSNRPFSDVARGLAVFGIASLRYDNRALAAPQTIDPIRSTVHETLIDDALAALQFLRDQVGIDNARIWIVGHDLGGSLAPTIARLDRNVRGIVILGGSLRPLDVILRDRILATSGVAGQDSDAATVADPEIRQMLAMLDSLGAGTLPETRFIMGRSAHFMSDYRSRDLAGDLAAFKGPILLLFAGKDEKMTQADKDSWAEATVRSGMKNVTSCTLAGLDHIFIPVKDASSERAPAGPGHVDPAMIDQISRFILSPP